MILIYENNKNFIFVESELFICVVVMNKYGWRERIKINIGNLKLQNKQ